MELVAFCKLPSLDQGPACVTVQLICLCKYLWLANLSLGKHILVVYLLFTNFIHPTTANYHIAKLFGRHHYNLQPRMK